MSSKNQVVHFPGARVGLFCGAAMLLATGCGDITPREGAWIHEAGAITDDTCNLGADTPTDPYGEFTIGELNGDSFRITPGSADSFSCTLLGGGDFECPDRVADGIPIDNFDATINVNVRVDGTFSSETEASGTQTFSASCEGADCSNPLFVQGIKLFYPNTTLPCGYTIGFTADAK